MTLQPQNPYTVRLLDSVADIDRDAWDRLFGHRCEGYDYLLACEQAPAASFRYLAVAVFDGPRMVAGAPLFETTLPLQTLLEGLAQRLLGGLDRVLPRLTRVRLLGVGSPHVDELPLALDADLDRPQQQQALAALDSALTGTLRSRGYDVLLWKNLGEQPAAHREWLLNKGYAPIAGLPVAMLDIRDSEAAYIGSLSANNRSTLRRKLKKSRDVRIEIRQDCADLEPQLNQLREQTRARAPTDYDVFEELGPGYIGSVLRHLPDQARLLLYWDGSTLLGFTLVLIEPGQVKEKYTGARYPQALESGLFFRNWMGLQELCRAQQVPLLRAGETTYLTKLRLGCRLEPSWLLVKHRRAAINWLLRRISRHFDLDRSDPDLRTMELPAK